MFQLSRVCSCVLGGGLAPGNWGWGGGKRELRPAEATAISTSHQDLFAVVIGCPRPGATGDTLASRGALRDVAIHKGLRADQEH